MLRDEIEQSLLGCLVMRPKYIADIKASCDDFENHRNRKIYQAMLDLWADGQPLEPVLVADRVGDKSVIKYLFELNEHVGTSENIKHYDQRLREISAKSRAFVMGQLITKMAANGSTPESILAKVKELTIELTEKIEGKKSLVIQIDEWISSNKGKSFFVTECDREHGIVTKRDKDNRRQILNRLLKKGIICKASNRQGHYRVVEDTIETINYREAKSDEIFPIKWPFSLEDYVRILPKSIIVVAGAWEAGKTAFLLNVARMNMNKHHVRYMSSEMGDAEFRLRLDLFVDMAPDDWKMEAIERSSDYEDAILPDALNIIDYLEISDNFFLIGEKIRRIYDRLKKGVAVIAIQKATGMELARGGDFSAEKARLYLRLDQGELEIMKGKLWANPQVNPRNMLFPFKLWQGHKFVAAGEPYKKIKQPKKTA